ncbi:MAG: metal ABC transporter permease [Clostridia bacterium]
MELIYGLIDLLPFEFTKYAFMKNALLAIILISPIFAMLGTMIVNNKMAFFSDALRTFCHCRYCNWNAIWNSRY